MEAVVEYNYVAKEPDELTLRKGDVIKDIKMILGGWWEGTLRDKRGMFPDNFVKVRTPPQEEIGMVAGSRASAGSASGEGSTSGAAEEVTLRNGGSGRKTCRVLFSYEPCNPDELKLVPNDTIEFLGEVEEGWWRGRNNRRIGVFPSNFVAPPTSDEISKSKEKDEEELCRVLFPYQASNEDELTLIEGDIIRLLSRDAPDKGWWQGQLRGQIGLFPDNFVEVINSKSDQQDQDQWQETNQVTSKVKHTTKRTEKAHIRKSLDTRTRTDTASKKTPSPSSATPILGSGSGDKKSGNHSILSSLKRLVGDSGSNNGNGSVNMGLEEELDGVERGEGLPLSHLTASRAKAPRRRPPTTQHLRHTAASSTTSVVSSNSANFLTDEGITNGNGDNTGEQHRDDDGDGPVGKARRKAPWLDELHLNQLERRKHGVDRVDKIEVKKERIFSRLSTSTNVAEVGIKPEPESEELKPKESERTTPTDSSNHVPHASSSTPTHLHPAFVPYHLYSQLLDRVGVLEEKQIVLQRTVNQLSEQLISLLEKKSTSEE